MVAKRVQALTSMRLNAGQSWRALRRQVAGVVRLPVLNGASTDAIAIAPADLNTTDPIFAEDLLAGRFVLAGHVVQAQHHSIFAMPPPSRAWQEALLSFQWLRHMAMVRSEMAQVRARALIDEWIAAQGHGHAVGWQADILGARLMAWLMASPAVLTGAESGFYRRFVTSLMAQSRYLQAVRRFLEPGAPRLMSALTLTMVGLSLARNKTLFVKASKALASELQRQIGEDGGHISRNPAVIVEILSGLLPLQMLYAHRSEPVPPVIPRAIERMLGYLRLMRHADGALAGFNGASAVPQELLASLLAHAEERGVRRDLVAVGGYRRLEADGAVVLVDAGATPTLYSRQAHAGALAFEFSANRHRLVVNCGAPQLMRERWQEVVRATAAHSTLTLEDASSSRIDGNGLMIRMPKTITAQASGDGDGHGLSLSHDGYVPDFGAVHERELRLAADGKRLEGEDRLKLARAGLRADVRFHLHPNVEVFRDERVEGLILSMADGPEWLFSCNRPYEVQESVFVSGVDGPRRTQQIVISGLTDIQGWGAQWAFAAVE